MGYRSPLRWRRTFCAFHSSIGWVSIRRWTFGSECRMTASSSPSSCSRSRNSRSAGDQRSKRAATPSRASCNCLLLASGSRDSRSCNMGISCCPTASPVGCGSVGVSSRGSWRPPATEQTKARRKSACSNRSGVRRSRLAASNASRATDRCKRAVNLPAASSNSGKV